MQYSKSQDGLTLVELITVVGIISILGAIGTQSLRCFVVESKRSEARVSLAYAFGLQLSYHETAGNYYSSPMPVRITGTDISGPETCNTSAGGIALGFKVSNCQQSRYCYATRTQTNPPDPPSFQVFAMERVVGGARKCCSTPIAGAPAAFGCPLYPDADLMFLTYEWDGSNMDKRVDSIPCTDCD